MLIIQNKQKRRRSHELIICIRAREKGKHLSFDEREELEAIVNKNNGGDLEKKK
jgi:hypothetical protein